MTTPAVPVWEIKAKGWNDDTLAKIPQDWLSPNDESLRDDVSDIVTNSELLTRREHEIVECDATALRDALSSRTYTAVEVTTAYAKAAAVVHQATNCLMDFFYDDAIKRAQWLDEEFERTGRPVGVLHGVPISIKDPFAVAHKNSTAGFVSWIGERIPDEDGTVPAILRAAGAVFIVKTMTPQAIMMIETESAFGITVNPHNRNLTAGGSTGGEGALIAAGGSVLGVGTDIGGSIRAPSACNGIFGFKPTAERIPNGFTNPVEGNEAILSATGPLARSARDLELFITTVLAAKPWTFDCSAAPMPWRPNEVEWLGGLRPRIGVLWHDGIVQLHPPVARALKTAVDKLKDAGYEVVDYKPYRVEDAWDILAKLFFTDGGKAVKAAVEASGEPLFKGVEMLIDISKDLTATELWQLVNRRNALRNDYARHWNESKVDVLLCPPAVGPAQVCGTTKYFTYTGIWNVLDYPAAIFPTGLRVEPTDRPVKRTEFLGPQDKDLWATYDSPDTFANAPLSLQIVGPRWEDEKVVQALHIISKVVRFQAEVLVMRDL